MSFSKALYFNLKDESPYPLFYGSAIGSAPIYYVMLPVTQDAQQPETVCQEQGGQGRASFQFSVVGVSGAGAAEDLLDPLISLVRAKIGDLSYNGNTWSIWKNETAGARALGGSDFGTWDAIFETTLWWEQK